MSPVREIEIQDSYSRGFLFTGTYCMERRLYFKVLVEQKGSSDKPYSLKLPENRDSVRLKVFNHLIWTFPGSSVCLHEY